jgi:hypothetical protein
MKHLCCWKPPCACTAPRWIWQLVTDESGNHTQSIPDGFGNWSLMSLAIIHNQSPMDLAIGH